MLKGSGLGHLPAGNISCRTSYRFASTPRRGPANSCDAKNRLSARQTLQRKFFVPIWRLSYRSLTKNDFSRPSEFIFMSSSVFPGLATSAFSELHFHNFFRNIVCGSPHSLYRRRVNLSQTHWDCLLSSALCKVFSKMKNIGFSN